MRRPKIPKRKWKGAAAKIAAIAAGMAVVLTGVDPKDASCALAIMPQDVWGLNLKKTLEREAEEEREEAVEAEAAELAEAEAAAAKVGKSTTKLISKGGKENELTGEEKLATAASGDGVSLPGSADFLSEAKYQVYNIIRDVPGGLSVGEQQAILKKEEAAKAAKAIRDANAPQQ